MNILQEIKPIFLNQEEFVPNVLEDGVLYIHEHFGLAIHNCACGCGGKTVTPLGNRGWTLTKNGDKVSLNPSIGNWSGENPYHAHYFIVENKINWC